MCALFRLVHVTLDVSTLMAPVETRTNTQTNRNTAAEPKAGGPRTVYANQTEERGAGEEVVWERGVVSKRR